MSVAIPLLALTPLLIPQSSTPPQDDQGFKQPAVLEGRFLLPNGTQLTWHRFPELSS